MSDFSRLRLYVDTADTAVWQRYLATGVFYGVTTNPKLLYRAGMANTVENLAGLAREAFDLGAQEIHLQVWGGDTEPMLAVGRQLASADSRVSVKVPLTEAGLLCARQLIAEGTRVTLTALHAATQMLPAAALGAAYAAPYLGRMEDAGLDGLDEILAMQEMVTRLHSSTRVLVASIRRLDDLAALARGGCDTFTLLPGLVEELLANPHTLRAAADFEEKAAA